MARGRGALRAAAAAAIAAALLAFLLFHREGDVDRPDATDVAQPADSARTPGASPAATRSPATAAAPASAAAEESAAAPSAPAAASTTPSARRGAARVRVRDAADLKPVAGATVTLVDGRDTRTGTTDAAGEAVFPELVDTHCSVVVAAPGRDEARVPFVVERGTETLVDVRQRAWRILHGVVRSSRDGRPVSGASISLGLGSDLPEALQGSSVRSADDGRFALPRPSDRTSLSAFVTANGYVAVMLEIQSSRDSAPAVVELDPAGCIRGVVKARDGAPVEGARVAIWPADGSWTRHEPRTRQVENACEVKTDAGGGFRFEDRARGGVYLLRAWSDDQSGLAAEARVFLPPDDAEASAELVFGGAGTLRVAWSPTTPGERVMVAILSIEKEVKPLAMEAASESPIEFSSLPEGPVAVRVWSGGSRGEASAEVAPGATTDVTVNLRPGAAIEGVVQDAAGAPAAGVRVHAELLRFSDESTSPSLAAGDTLRISGSAVSDSAGRFRMEGLPHGVSLAVRVPSRSRSVQVTAPATGVVIVVTATGDVRGTLVAAPGAIPPERMNILIESADGRSWVTPQDWRGGFFRLTELPVGKYRLSALAGTSALVAREVEVPAGRSADLGRLQMVAAPQTSGVVRDAAGKPVVGAFVRVLGPTLTGLWGVTIESGRFLLGGLPPGKYRVAVESRIPEAKSIHSVEVGPEGADVALTHLFGGTVRGVARDPGGVPFAGAMVLVSPVDGGEALSRSWVDHVGRYQVRAPAGEHRIQVLEGEKVVAEGRATVTDGGDAVLDLVGER